MSIPRRGLGPVFAFEWLTTSRKWQVYALRSLFVGVLLVAIWMVWLSWQDSLRYRSAIRVLAEMGRSLFYALTMVQLALVMLAAPAATAGAICLDKARGTLLHLLVTDLSDAEVVLGKLAARLVPTLGVVFCTLPVLALSILLGGVDPVALAGAFLVTLAVAILGCSLAMLLSIWAGKTHEVLMAVYVTWLGWVMALPIALWVERVWAGSRWIRFDGWFAKANPVWIVTAPMAQIPGIQVGLVDQILFSVAVLAVSVGLTIVAIATVRRAALRSTHRSTFRLPGVSRSGRPWIEPLIRPVPGPSLDANPVLWREWHRERPSRWTRLVWGGYVTAAVLASALAILHSQDSSFPWREFSAIVNVCQVGAGLLLMSVTASTSLAEERVRGSLDVLMTTPLSTSSIVLGKWLGAFRHVPWLALLPGLVGAALALRTGRWYGAVWIFLTVLVQGATIVSLGLALATWVPRVGRATGLTVAAYVLMALGWIFVVIVLSPTRTDWAELMIMGSPLFSAGYLTSEVDAAGPGWRDWVYYVAPPLWTAAYFAAALAMYGASLLTFNRCLGRITMMGPPPGRGDVKKWTWEARVSPGMAFEEP